MDLYGWEKAKCGDVEDAKNTRSGLCIVACLERKSGLLIFIVKSRRYDDIKAQEARSRSTVVGSKGTRLAMRQQRRVSLAGGAKWRITNWRQVAVAMAKWA